MIEQMMAQMSATEERYRDHEAERDVRQQHLNSLGNGGDWTKVDSPERVLERVARLGFEQMAGEALEALAESPREENAPLMFDTPPMLDVFERIIGKNDLIGTSFILQGAQVARSVGRIVIRSPFGILQGYGTGLRILLNEVLGLLPMRVVMHYDAGPIGHQLTCNGPPNPLGSPGYQYVLSFKIHDVFR